MTKPKRGGRTIKAPTVAAGTAAKKSVAAKAASAATAAKTALKKNTIGANKKVVIAEPVAGRRVLRKRN